MWSPTHVQVTVCRAKGLLTKGKNGTNDAFVTIAVEKEKFQTSVKQKALPNVEWQEECELAIPSQGNTAEITLTVLHQNFIGVDEFLGVVTLPLSSFDVYERPKARWYPLKSKPGQENKTKYRGELEVRVGFTVKSGSLLDLSKKDKLRGSFGHISHAANSIGGSLMSLGSKEKKGLKKLASSMGHKLKLPNRGRSMREDKSDGRFSRQSSGRLSDKYSSGEPDPGVISEDEDEFRFDELSHKSSGSSLNLAGSQASGSLENLGGGDLVRHNSMNRGGTLPGRLISPSMTSQTRRSPNVESQSSTQITQGKNVPKEEHDWNHKLFGTKPNHVSKEEELASSSIDSGVPSIIIQDSFILEENLPPSTSVDLQRQIVGNKTQSSKKKSQESTSSKDIPRQNKAASEKTVDSHRSKMAASFHQRVVVGEEMTADQSRDSHFNGNLSNSNKATRDVRNQYQSKSREELINLLEDRDQQLKDLKEYIDTLLARVIDTCPTLLQKPYKEQKSPLKKK